MTDLELTLCEQILKIQETLIGTASSKGAVTLKQTVDHSASIARRAVANDKFNSGFKPSHSTGIWGSMTAGYGNFDSNGVFQYPLRVNQETKEVGVWL